MSKKNLTFPWLVNARYDMTYFSGSVLISPLLFLLYFTLNHFFPGMGNYPALLVYFIYVAILDFPHIFQTFSRTHKDKAEYNRHKAHINGGLAVIVILTILATATGQYVAYYRLINIFGIWHLLRQNIGFLRAYSRKGPTELNKFDVIIQEGIYFAIVAHLFFHNAEIEEFLEDSISENISEQPLMLMMEQASLDFFLGFLGAFILRQVYLFYKGEPLNIPKLIFMGTTVCNYLFYGMVNMPLLVFLALETSYHDIQYHGFMRQYQRKRFPTEKHTVRNWFFAALLFGLIGGGLEYIGRVTYMDSPEEKVMWLDMPFAIFVLYHYYIDGFIWRFRESPELRDIFTNNE